MKNQTIWQKILYLYIVAVLAFSAYPIPERIKLGNDKINHIAAFIIFAFLFYRSFPRTGILPVFGWGILFGVLIESVQYFVPGRSAELLDVAADGIGLILGISAENIWKGILKL